MLDFYRTYTTPFKEKIPASVDDFFKRVSFLKRFKRFFGRYLYTEIALRNSQKLEKITPQHQKILWVQWVDSYLGDSLMDLSSRILLQDRDIDLLTKENTAKIYQKDSIFDNIFNSPVNCMSRKYDLIIIDSYRQRSLRMITKYFATLPHVTLFGYYNVDDFNRLYFSFYRINQLLDYSFDSARIKKTAKPTLTITKSDELIVDSLNLPKEFITIAIGGASSQRTFLKWNELVSGLLSKKLVKNIALIGLADAQKDADYISGMYPNNIINVVGKCSFKQSARVIQKSQALICADGGLLHAANAVNTPIVGLFYYIDPLVRLLDSNPSFGLVDKENINNISIEDIIEKFDRVKEIV